MKKIEAIILAAGESRRFGTNKLLFRINGKTMIERCISSLYHFCDNIIVVTGCYNLYFDNKKIMVVKNDHYQEGMFRSIKEGLKYIKGQRFFIIPGDYPFIKKETYQTLLKSTADIVIPSYRGKRGHPILLNSNLISEILQYQDGSLEEFIRSKSIKLVEVEDKGILIDIDTIDEYNNYISER